MNFSGLIFLVVAHVLCGRGVLRLFRISLQPIPGLCISMMTGVVLLSFAPCLLQLAGIPITGLYTGIAIVVLTILFSIPLLIKFKRPQFKKIPLPALYEWPFFIVFAILLFVSAWRCFYFPPTARDILTGPELLAEYAVREQNVISSVFTIDLHTSNNYFKSPFITGLQIIYKLLVCPFGQIWLSLLFLSFVTWLYTLARNRLHPLLAGLLLLFFITIPDLYAYSYLMLYDYSNMIFFFCGFYFLTRYIKNNELSDLVFSAFLFGLATYIRTETLVLVTMIVPLLIIYFYREKLRFTKVIYRLCLFIMIPAAFYFICIYVFVRNFIPIPFDVGSQVNPDLGNISPFFQRIRDMNTELIFSKERIEAYGYFTYFFCSILIIDIIWPRRFNREGLVALYGIAVVLIGLALIGYLLPLADLMNTTKRGLFKMFPLMFFYICNSGIFLHFSGVIKKWEAVGKSKNKI